jgi:hypothetical protein
MARAERRAARTRGSRRPLSDPRVELAAAASGVDAERVLTEFDHFRPIIHVRRSPSLHEANAAAALYACVTRTFASVEMDGDGDLGINPWGARQLSDLPGLLRSIRPSPACRSTEDVTVAIDPWATRADLWVGGGGMTATIGRSPCEITDDHSGIGLQASAMMAAAELVKSPFASLGLPVNPLNQEFIWNFVDFGPRPAPRLELPALTQPAVVLLGAGSVGTSSASLLAMETEVTGQAQAVDPDSFDPARNPFRYPAITSETDGPKAVWVMDLLRSAGWTTPVEPFIGRVGDWVTRQPAPVIRDLIVSSVDQRGGRLEVADALGDTTLSLGVGGLSFHLQREHLGDGFACPFCDFVSLAPTASQAAVHAEVTGLPIARVLALSAQDVLTESDVEIAVTSGRIHADRAPTLIGKRLEDLIRAAYAQATFGTPGHEVRVSAPHVSWFAGLLGAAEIVKAAFGIPLIDRRIDIDTLGLPPQCNRRGEEESTGRCVCHSPWRRRAMQGSLG